jgi:hypothetical protein
MDDEKKIVKTEELDFLRRLRLHFKTIFVIYCVKDFYSYIVVAVV